MYQDEAGFGRILKPTTCWTPRKEHPTVPCHPIREYRYAFGAVSPQMGDHFFLVLSYSNTLCLTNFLAELSRVYED